MDGAPRRRPAGRRHASRVIRSLRPATASGCWRCTRACRRTRSGCGSSRRARPPDGRTWRDCSTSPTTRRSRWLLCCRGRIAALATAELLSQDTRGGRLPGVRRGSRPGARQPSPRAPRGAVPRARRHPIRGRGARGQLRDAGRLPGCGLRGGAQEPWTARCRSSCAPRRPPPPSTPRTAASGAPRRARCARCCTPRASRWSAYAAPRPAGQRRARGDPRRGLRRPAVRRAPGGRFRGRRAGPPQPGRDRGAPVDLVVVVVPAVRSLAVMADAAAAGVGAAIVVSSGFAGPDGLGVAAERELLRTARAHSVRVVGPDSQGVLSQGPEMRPQRHVRAGAAGAGRAGDRLAVGRGRVHVAGPGPRPGRGRALVRLARRQARRLQQRPVGRVDGRRAGRCRRTPPGVVRQRPQVRPDRPPLRGAQAPVGRASVPGRLRDLRRLGDRRRRPLRPGGRDPVPERHRVAETAALLLGQPLPAGYRVGVVTNAGGMGTLVADLADAEGLSVPELSGEGRRGLQRAVPGAVRTRNPVDLGADLSPAALEAGVRTLLASPSSTRSWCVLVPTSLADPAGLFDAAVGRARAHVRPAGPARRLQRGRAGRPRRDRLPDRGGGGGGAGAHDEVRRVAAGSRRGPAAALGVGGPPSPARGRPSVSPRAAGGRVAARAGERRAARAVRHRPRRRRGPGCRRGLAGPRRRSASRSW